MDVSGLAAEAQRIDRQMRLQDAAMRLRLQHGEPRQHRADAQIDPGRDVRDRNLGISVEHQLCDDLLHPAGARSGIAGHHHIVAAKRQVVPDGRVEMGTM